VSEEVVDDLRVGERLGRLSIADRLEVAAVHHLLELSTDRHREERLVEVHALAHEREAARTDHRA